MTQGDVLPLNYSRFPTNYTCGIGPTATCRCTACFTESDERDSMPVKIYDLLVPIPSSPVINRKL
jgi:hypothetical protein